MHTCSYSHIGVYVLKVSGVSGGVCVCMHMLECGHVGVQSYGRALCSQAVKHTNNNCGCCDYRKFACMPCICMHARLDACMHLSLPYTCMPIKTCMHALTRIFWEWVGAIAHLYMHVRQRGSVGSGSVPIAHAWMSRCLEQGGWGGVG